MRFCFSTCVFFFIFTLIGPVYAQENWSVILSNAALKEEAIRVCLEDLNETGNPLGATFTPVNARAKVIGNTIVVGDAIRNKVTADWVRAGQIQLAKMENPEGYRIITIPNEKGKTLIVAGGSVLGDVYGLYWIRDRLRICQSIPDIRVTRTPAFSIRYTRTPVRNKNDIRRALRYGLNTVYGMNPLRLILWNAEPERTENKKNRAITLELANYAHSLHMKFLVFGTDFTYHPSLLKECGASLSPSDPFFWDAVQEKYRKLFQSMPELDGVGTFLGEEQRYWGNYRTFDPIHDGQGCDWSLEKRYRTYVNKVYNVVVGEFNKLLFHRTWVTNCYEQHSQPAIYKNIFTNAVPVRNLYLIPSFTQNDRWWFQAYNPTFNLTPHRMMVVFESMDYHAAAHLFPTFPGPYFQAGLQTALDVRNPNLKGASLDLPGKEGWNTRSLTAYTVFRLEWDYHENIQKIAEDFAAIHFGKAAAKTIADLYRLSPVAYKYGLYIEPAAYGGFNSLPHIRVGQFVAEGYPSIDGGKEHIEFLRKIYLRCKPWIAETLQCLDHGLESANRMAEMYKPAERLIENQKLAKEVENSLNLTRLLIQTNNLYVKTFFAYFQYREHSTEKKRSHLGQLCADLKRSRTQFMQTPGYGYHLFGVDQLLKNVDDALANLQEAEERLAEAPTSEQIKQTVSELQKQYAEILHQHAKEAVKILHWEGRVDGRDILRIQGEHLKIEHLRWDPIYFGNYTFDHPLPKESITVIPKDIESRPMHPFILQQPSEENNFTSKVYLYDVPGGAGWCKFDLYYIRKKPRQLGLKVPWEGESPDEPQKMRRN